MNYKSIYTSPRFDDEEDEKKQKMPDPFSDRFLKTRQIVLTGEVNKELADSIAKQLLILDAEDSKSPTELTSTLPNHTTTLHFF